VTLAGMRRWIEARARWLRAPELSFVVVLVAVGVLITGFLVLGSEVAEGDTTSFDHAILLALRHAPDDPIGSRHLEAGVMHLSALGSIAVATLVTAIAVGFLALAGKRRYALLVAAAALGALLWMSLLKHLYGRERPTVVTHIDPPGSLSFPSGHSMIAAALYLTLAVLVARTVTVRRLRIYVVAVGATLALLVGASRVYLGVHYPTDVIGGWTVGMAWALICGLVARWLGRHGQVEGPGPASDAPAADAAA
jgi:undecaprenyl-diphosphatase